MVAEAGQPVLFAEMAQFAAGMTLARNTIDLYLALPHEEANPVPADELVRGRVASACAATSPWASSWRSPRTTGPSSWRSRS